MRAQRRCTPSRATTLPTGMDGATQIGSKHASQTKLFHGLTSSRVATIFAVPRTLDRTRADSDRFSFLWVGRRPMRNSVIMRVSERLPIIQSQATIRFFVIFLQIETRGFRFLLPLGPLGHAPGFILRHYTAENSVFPVFPQECSHASLDLRERPGYKRSRRHGEVRTFLGSHAGPLAGLRRTIPYNPADC